MEVKNKRKRPNYLGRDSTVSRVHVHCYLAVRLRRMDFGIGVYSQGNIGVDMTMCRFQSEIFTGFFCLSQGKLGTKEKRDEEGWINDQGFPHRTMCAGNRNIVCCFHDGRSTR